ncbi:hypothetical protein J3F83DRAFT_91185 [Trichoderma novae-zelandiae]
MQCELLQASYIQDHGRHLVSWLSVLPRRCWVGSSSHLDGKSRTRKAAAQLATHTHYLHTYIQVHTDIHTIYIHTYIRIYSYTDKTHMRLYRQTHMRTYRHSTNQGQAARNLHLHLHLRLVCVCIALSSHTRVSLRVPITSPLHYHHVPRSRAQDSAARWYLSEVHTCFLHDSSPVSCAFACLALWAGEQAPSPVSSSPRLLPT